MLSRLLESRRARVLAGWALGASLAVHATTGGVATWLHQHGSRHAPATDGPISVRYLLPPDHLERPRGERIRWVPVGNPTTGFAAGTGPAAAAHRAAGDTPPPEARQREPAPEGDSPDATQLYSLEDVDSAAARDPASDGPRYPDALRDKGVQGAVLVEFTVDTSGRADTATFRVVEASHPLFVDAVRTALPSMRFTPAVAHGRHVRQLVRLPMRFQLLGPERPNT